MKKFILTLSLIVVLLITPFLSFNKNVVAMGQVNHNTSDIDTTVKDQNNSSHNSRKPYFLMVGGEPGSKLVKSQGETKSPSDSNSSKASNPSPMKGLLPNSRQPLITPTYEGSGQATHPSVIDFKVEYGIDKWNGYRYWMTFTPYPNSYDKYENPSILSSNDGVIWVVPPGFEKPLDIKETKKNFNSDPELIYDKDSNALNVYWREVLAEQYDKIWRIKINHNGKQEPKVLAIQEPWTSSSGESLALSPTVWRKSSNEWYMWTANGCSSIYLYTSTDGIKWSKRERCSTPWLDWNGGYIPWHLEAKPNYREQRIEFFIAGFPKGKSFSEMVIFYAETPMSAPTQLTMPLEDPILTKGNSKNWDGNLLYRTSFTIRQGNDAYYYDVWYSAMATAGQWRIGYTEGSIGTSFTPDPE